MMRDRELAFERAANAGKFNFPPFLKRRFPAENAHGDSVSETLKKSQEKGQSQQKKKHPDGCFFVGGATRT